MGFTVAELERELLVDRLRNDNMRLEIEEARGNLGSLADRLDVSLNQDGTIRPSELNISFVRDESTIVASAIDGAWLILDGDRSSVYVVDRRVRFNDNDTLTGFVQTAVYDAEADETTITFQEAAGVVINAIGFSFNPNTVSKIHHSELADILPAIEGADDTKNKHVSNLQLLNKVPYAQGIRRVADINALRLLTPDLCTVVFIECHTTPGDRGHGTFYWDAASTDADDWQNTIAVTGISTGRWKRNIDPITDDLSTYINLTTAQALSDAKFYADNQFVTQVLHQADIDNIQSQLDGQVVAWFYTGYAPTTANIPANAWTTTAIKEQHANDTFTRLDTGQSWRWVYDGGVWKWVEIMDTATTAALSLAAQARDTADEKRRVFVTQPTVPYDVGDLWTTATTLKRCMTAKTSAGIFAEGDWISAADVTNYLTIYDTAQGYANSAQAQALLDAQTYADGKFVTQVLHQEDIDNLQSQLDGQVVAWFYDYEPTAANVPASLWTTEALKDEHANDTFTHLTTGQSWRWVYDAGVWKWLEIADTATTAALAAALQAQDTADNKRRVFTAQPTVPYDEGDLWADGTTLLRCVTPKTSTGSYAAGDWLAVADKTDYANAETFPAAITPDLMVRRGSTFERVAGATAWGIAQACSANKYTGGCRVAFRAGFSNKMTMFGINSDPTLNASYTSIDYCFYLENNATVVIYESAVLRSIGAPAYTTNTLFEIIYDGAEVRYLMDGVVVRTVSGLANNLTFYMDSSFYIIGSKVTHVEWGPYGPTLSETQILASTAEANAKSYTDGNFVTKVLHQTDISNLQSQVDGQVSAWFYSYAPTTANAPASSWTTVALKEQHADDTFTRLDTGQSWRWVNTAGVWGWTEIADTATVTALAAAAQAQDTADNKRRVFVNQPTVPYDIGDLWTTGSTISRCVTAKTTAGSYAAGDWVAVADATNYDDYRVSNVKTENDVTTIARPVGGTYYSGGLVTGAIKITLPQSWSHTMMKFGVDIRQHNATKSFTLQLGGFNNATSSVWVYSFAQLAGSTASNNRVRFGHDGTKCCILIGDVTSVWNYPAVVVKDFQASHSNFSRDKWETGWAISIVTDISGITTTADIADTLIDAKSILGQGALATQNTADYGTQVTGTKPPADADSTATVIGRGFITTGYIGNKGKTDPLLTLGINFETAEILVGAAAGLKIKSGGGILVESGGGITVKDGGGILVESGGALSLDSGGDLVLTAGYTNPSKIKFMRSSADANPMLIYGGIGDSYYPTLTIAPATTDTAGLRLGLSSNKLYNLTGAASFVSFDTGDFNTGSIGFFANNIAGGSAKISSTGPINASGLRPTAECSCTSKNGVGDALLTSSHKTQVKSDALVEITAPDITITGSNGTKISAPIRTTNPTASEVPNNQVMIYTVGTATRLAANINGTMYIRTL